MKKMTALGLALILCLGLCAASAETKVETKEYEVYSLQLNAQANTLILTDRETRMKRVTDLDLNPLSGDYPSINIENGYYAVSQDNVLKQGLLDGQGRMILPMEYGDFDIISDRWIAGIRLKQSTSENYDYKSLWGDEAFFLVDTVDIYYRGELKGTLSRQEWQYANPYGDYLCIRDREGKPSFYNRDFVKSEAGSGYASEYDENYSEKTVTHQGSNQLAFTASCTLTPDEVQQSVWINRDKQLVDLQGNVIADLSAYSSAYVSGQSGLINLQDSEGRKGLADWAGNLLVPCEYDDMDPVGAKESGFLYAVRDGKAGFVNLETGAETGFVFNKDAGNRRAAFIFVDDPREGKILVSAMAGELPDRYQDASAPSSSSRCLLAAVQDQDGLCRVIGQLGEDVLPGVTFRSVYDPSFSADGTVILLQTESGRYSVFRVDYDTGLSGASTSTPAAGDETWTCENGHTGLTGNFCSECGAKRPE